MKAEKDPKSGKWLIQYRYKDWTGASKKSTKRGFRTKREAEEWVRNFLMTQTHSLDMKFSDFVELYFADMRNRLREHRESRQACFQAPQWHRRRSNSPSV